MAPTKDTAVAEVSAAKLRRRFRLLVFDWDGTLADSTAIIAGALQQACREMGEPIPNEESARHVIGLGLADAMRHVAPSLSPERYGDLAARYRQNYFARDPEIPLFDGVREMLDELDAAGFLLAVATGKTRAGLAHAMARQEIAHMFAATRCADESAPKPSPEMLLHLMELLGADPGETLMIGDTTHDLILAKQAGVSAIAVTYGAHPTIELTRGSPLAIVDSVEELRAWLHANA
jgi:phosphoglycolate phosphatase